MLHTTMRDAIGNPMIKSVDERLLPKVDYVALGHLHIKYQKDNLALHPQCVNKALDVYDFPHFFL